MALPSPRALTETTSSGETSFSSACPAGPRGESQEPSGMPDEAPTTKAAVGRCGPESEKLVVARHVPIGGRRDVSYGAEPDHRFGWAGDGCAHNADVRRPAPRRIR